MVPSERPSVSVCPRGSDDPGSDPRRTVVWVRGDHEHATRVHLSTMFDQAARVDDSDIVIDLSGVTFMDASTINAVVEAHNRLRARSRSLSLRAPSRLARRLFDVCELAFLIDERPAPTSSRGAPALGSWVAVPASDRTSAPTTTVDEHAPHRERAGTSASVRVESAGSVERRRTPL